MTEKEQTVIDFAKLLRDAEKFYSDYPEFSWVGNIETARSLGVEIKEPEIEKVL